MARIESWFDQDIKKPVKVHHISGNVFTQDNLGNLIGVRVFDHGEAVTLSGSVSANVIRPDGGTIAVTGTLSGNQAYVELPQAAYLLPGMIAVIIKLTSGSVVTTLCAVTAIVYRSSTDTVIDPGTIIPNIQTLINQIEAAYETIPADYTALVNQVNDGFDRLVGNRPLAFSSGKYACVSNTQIGETVSYSTTTSYVCAISPCSKGDVFKAHTYGYGGTNKAYFICDANMVCLEAAPANELNGSVTITQDNAAFITFTNRLSSLGSGYYAYSANNPLIRSEIARIDGILPNVFLDTHNGDYFALDDDLDDILTVGTYSCLTSEIAQSLDNSPFPGSVIRLIVFRYSNATNSLGQIVLDRATGGYATRSYNSGWGSWEYNDQISSTETLLSEASTWSLDGDLTRTGFDARTDEKYYASDYIAVTAESYLHFVKCMSSADYYMCFFYNADHVVLGGVITDLTRATYDDVFIVVPQDAVYMRAMVRATNKSIAKIYTVTSRSVEKPNDVGIKAIQNFVAGTNNRFTAPFVNLKASHDPLFTIIDDDTRGVNQVTDFLKVCNDNGVYGTSATCVKYLQDNNAIKEALLAGELQGHQTVFHCWEQAGNTIWTDSANHIPEVTENVVKGIHGISNMGFADWRHWVTPAGVKGKYIQMLARRYGFDSITTITQNDYIGYDGTWTRWNIPRMELYPDDLDHAEGQTLAGIKAKIDECVSAGAWLLVGVHCYQDSDFDSVKYAGSKGWNNLDGQPNIHASEVTDATTQARFEARFARMYEMLQYASTAGMRFVTLGEGLSYWKPIFRMYESF